MTPTKPNTERVGLTPEMRRDEAAAEYQMDENRAKRGPATSFSYGADWKEADMLKNPPEELTRLLEAIRQYERESTNPVPDYVLRKMRRDQMFAALKAFDDAKACNVNVESRKSE